MQHRSHGKWGRHGVGALCLITLLGCGSESETIVNDVPESENLFFTEDGRLFVSGGDNVFEIIQQEDGSYDKLDTFQGDCLIEGTILRQGYVYAVCSKTRLSELADSYFLAGQLSEQAPSAEDVIEAGVHPHIQLEVIAPLPELGLPNGIDVDEHGSIFVADSGKGDIVKIDMATPTEIGSLTVWDENTAMFVNGLNWVGDRLYYTGLKYNSLLSVFGYVERNPDGSAGARHVLFQRWGTVLDDFAPYDGGFVITDYLKGTVLYWKDGVIMETAPDTFFAPTAVIPAQPPMFDSSALVVTEKGIIFNHNPAFGNKVGLFYPGAGWGE
ncbi:MAG: hypothetical protein VYA55_11270 [Pseudomonadota bacterium]|nr:hypothetical protein [Pseudomonadota bacterium]